MGLKEKRAVKAIEENHYPALKQEVLDTLGFDVEIVVDWDSLADSECPFSKEEDFADVFFKPLVKVLKEICCDDMGKDALREVLTKIQIQNTKENWSATSWSEFKDGVLTLEHQCTNMGNIGDREYYLQEVVEKGLG